MATKNNASDIDLIEDLNSDYTGGGSLSLGPISISSRDWTVETIVSQITLNNIDLNPSFQRRNAWNDVKRSKLIESLIWGIPVPQIVLAEDRNKPRSFIVIDGKQRLLTIAGYLNPAIDYWKQPKLQKLDRFPDLNSVDKDELKSNPKFAEDYRNLMNADIRCTVISGYESEEILYEIFLRMNTGSTQLSTQELRQVLCRGWFADWLIKKTSTHQPIHKVLGIEDSDIRLADVEILLRSICNELFAQNYNGNMKRFLDESMKHITIHFNESDIEKVYKKINSGIRRLELCFSMENIGRKAKSNAFEGRFNRAVFEVQQYFFSRLPISTTEAAIKDFSKKYLTWFEKNSTFRQSVESTTKSIENTKTRFSEFGKVVNSHFGTKIKSPLQ